MMLQKRSYRDKLLPSFAGTSDGAASFAEARRGKRVVFTNGCFDLLHSGHLALLESAAAQGDILVVGVNEDASVSHLKGPERPFVPFEQRAALLAGLEAVDYVVGFAEPTPLRLIEDLRPDVLVKGADWSAEAIVGRGVVEANGGSVVRRPLVRGRSTTELVRRIRRHGYDETPGG
jgi:D-beta-D-heptose 7-phosphate kinase/D-beta-D-heptose 1-phosphate adenosyltransferase